MFAKLSPESYSGMEYTASVLHCQSNKTIGFSSKVAKNMWVVQMWLPALYEEVLKAPGLLVCVMCGKY